MAIADRRRDARQRETGGRIPARRRSAAGGRSADGAIPVAMLLPALVLLLLIVVGPFFYMVGISFTDLSYALPGHDGNFVGFDNYRRLVRDDPVFWQSFMTTMTFVFVVVSVEFVAGFGLALLLYHQVRQRRFLLTLLLVPMMLAPVAVGLIWKLLLQGDFGMATYYLHAFGIMDRNTAPLSNPDLVLPTIMLIDIWEWTPFVTLVLLAGLLSLPREPFEAAVMDGAGRIRIFRDVTLPLLRPIIALVLLLRAIDAFKEFDKVYILTGGGPGTLTELLSIYTYRMNFKEWDLGYGAVCASMVYLVVLILCAMFFKVVYWKDAAARSKAGVAR